MNLYDTSIDDVWDELVTENFAWTDYYGKLHIHLPSLKDRLNAVGLTIIEIDEGKDD